MKLIGRVNGVEGHYCIGRLKAGTWEFYNKGKWTFVGEVFDSEQKAILAMKKLIICKLRCETGSEDGTCDCYSPADCPNPPIREFL